MAYTDASWGSRPDGSSQIAYFVFCAPWVYLQGQRSMLTPVSWTSSKSQRVCRSSLAAEIQGIAEGQDELDYVRLVWKELSEGQVNLETYQEEIKQIPGGLVSDCRSFYDAINAKESSNLGMKDKRSAIETLSIRQNCQMTSTPVFWVNSDAQLGDGLTKGKAAFKLEEFFGKHEQQWRLVFDEAVLSAKRRRALGLGPLEDSVRTSGDADLVRHMEQGISEADASHDSVEPPDS